MQDITHLPWMRTTLREETVKALGGAVQGFNGHSCHDLSEES